MCHHPPHPHHNLLLLEQTLAQPALSWSNGYHYSDVIITTIASQITSLTVVYSAVYLDADQRKLQSSASLAFAQGIHRWPVNSPCKGPVTRKMFPFDDVIMCSNCYIEEWDAMIHPYANLSGSLAKPPLTWMMKHVPQQTLEAITHHAITSIALR